MEIPWRKSRPELLPEKSERDAHVRSWRGEQPLLRPSLSPAVSAASPRCLASTRALLFNPSPWSDLEKQVSEVLVAFFFPPFFFFSSSLFLVCCPNRERLGVKKELAAWGSSGMWSCPCAELPRLTITRNAAECQAAGTAHRPISAPGEQEPSHALANRR